MPSVSIICGVLLIVIGISGYLVGSTDGRSSWTALIPAILGLFLAVLGFAAKSSENLRKHLMHVAVVVGLLGFFMTAGRLVMNLDKFALTPAALSQLSTAVVCLVFVILCIKSFIDARRNRVA